MLQIVSTTRKLWGFPFQPIQWDPQYRIYLPVLSRLLRCILYILISLILSDNYWSLIFTIITNLDYHQWFLCNGKQMTSGAISQVFANPIEDPQSTNTPPLRSRVYIVRHDIQRLTLQINMDGLEVAKSSASSLYPVMVIINELPPTIRQRNILVPFLFRKHGEVDFSDNLLKILRNDLNNLNQNGLQWWDPNGNENRTQIVPHCLCTDSMMKYKLLGIKSPSGYSSCPN